MRSPWALAWNVIEATVKPFIAETRAQLMVGVAHHIDFDRETGKPGATYYALIGRVLRAAPRDWIDAEIRRRQRKGITT